MTEHCIELLFFDTFAHDNTEEINLDLVQFPKPVYVNEVRIIPLGARVQADFPGGVRLGATNPSQFQIEFFVNDLGKPGASTFETLGGLEYDQNGRINLECVPDDSVRKIPTDGLVLKGLYTTITLAVYGTLANSITEQIVQVVNPPTQANTIADVQQIVSQSILPGQTIKQEWQQENAIKLEYDSCIEATASTAAAYQPYVVQPPQQQDYYKQDQQYSDYSYGSANTSVGVVVSDVAKDPRNYHSTGIISAQHLDIGSELWDVNKIPASASTSSSSRARVDADGRDVRRQNSECSANYQKDRGDYREKRYSRSDSVDRDRSTRGEYRDHDRDWIDREHDSRQTSENYHRSSDRGDQWGDDVDSPQRAHDGMVRRERRHEDGYRRSERYREDRDENRKRPRSPPPILSPKRPHTPQLSDSVSKPLPPALQQLPQAAALSHESQLLQSVKQEPLSPKPLTVKKELCDSPSAGAAIEEFDSSSQSQAIPLVVSAPPNITEEFEPILSDEELPLDDGLDQNQPQSGLYSDLDYDYTTYTNNDDLIKLFTPGVNDLQRYEAHNSKVVEEEQLKITIGIMDDYFKSSITKYTVEKFGRCNTEIKEEFVHLCEKFLEGTICSIEQFKQITTTHLTKTIPDGESIRFIIETLADWLDVALDYNVANLQDKSVYKVRHIKCGVRLSEYLCTSGNFIRYMWQQRTFNIHKALLQLYETEYMALSIKLMILKALDTYLTHQYSIDKFIKDGNGYKLLIQAMVKNPQVRIRFALNSIIKKLNLYELLRKMHGILKQMVQHDVDVAAEEINLLTKLLDQILRYCQCDMFTMSQPRRFLPVAAQFEVTRANNCKKQILINYFRMFDLLQCFVLLLNYPSMLNLPAIKTPIFEILSILAGDIDGLTYFCDNIDTLNVLIKCLLSQHVDIDYDSCDVGAKSHDLGLKMAYKLQSIYYIESIRDYNGVIDNLHALFCLTFAPQGRVACAEILSLNDNIKALLHCIDQKSLTINGYIIDLIHLCIATVPNIAFQEKYAKSLLRIVNSMYHETYATRINEIQDYLRPFETISISNYDNIAPILDYIEKNIDQIVFNPCTVITALRLIEYLGISDCKTGFSDNPFNNYMELKYKHVILQLYSLDGTSIITKLLQKLSNHYEQPAMHSATFVSSPIVNVIAPALKLLKKMLSYVIQCRNTLFRDLTHINILLQTYNLLNSFPTSSCSYNLAQEAKVTIIDTLLVYTQPVSEEYNEKDSLSKTLWTQMAGEVIRYVTTAPHTYISGLLMISELLPLPLPIQTRDDLSDCEIAWAINLRKLWAAHLHPHGALIQDMITRLYISNHPQLLNLLRRVCVQFADLAANSALMVARAVLDNLYECVPDVSSNALLNFLACLVTHSTIKCAVLHLIQTNAAVTSKPDQRYANLINIISKIIAAGSLESQECVLSIIQSFCDTEITLMQCNVTPLKYLANALPVKEQLLTYISIILDYIGENSSASYVTYVPIVRTLLLLTEHDYGFLYLRENLLKRGGLFKALLKRLSSDFLKNSAEYLSTLGTLIEFLRVCVSLEEESGTDCVTPLYEARTICLSIDELKLLIGWDEVKEEEEKEEAIIVKKEKTEDEVEIKTEIVEKTDVQKHPLVVLEKIVKLEMETDTNFESILEGITAIMKLLRRQSDDDDQPPPVGVNIEKPDHENNPPILLPPPESLLVQFANRLISSSSDACDERLTDRYWLSTPTDVESDLEPAGVACDLYEICRENLSQEFNIIKEVEKLCRISQVDHLLDNKEKRSAIDKDKLKKPFVTPMRARGFARTVQQRSDLFRSRPPNTSRPPSLHVDDFVALETCGAQPTGPTGYNKISRELLAVTTRVGRGARGRAFVTSERSVQYNRQMQWWGAGIGRIPY